MGAATGDRFSVALLEAGDAVSSEGFDLVDWADVAAKCRGLSAAPLAGGTGGAWRAWCAGPELSQHSQMKGRSLTEKIGSGGGHPLRLVIALRDTIEPDPTGAAGGALAGYAKLKLLSRGGISAAEAEAVSAALQAAEGPPPTDAPLGYLGCVVTLPDWHGAGVGALLSLLATQLAAGCGCRLVVCYAMHPAMRKICDRLGYIDPTAKDDWLLPPELAEYWRPLQPVWGAVAALRGSVINRVLDLCADSRRWGRLSPGIVPPDEQALRVLAAEVEKRPPRAKLALERCSPGDRVDVFSSWGLGQQAGWLGATVKEIDLPADQCVVAFDRPYAGEQQRLHAALSHERHLGASTLVPAPPRLWASDHEAAAAPTPGVKGCPNARSCNMSPEHCLRWPPL